MSQASSLPNYRPRWPALPARAAGFRAVLSRRSPAPAATEGAGTPPSRKRQAALALSAARAVIAGLALAGLAGCAQRWPAGLDVDTSINAVSQDSRVRFIVLHYTSGSDRASLLTLSQGDVSAHYMITDTHPVKVYRLVPEDRNAWHAGDSSWYGHTSVNNASIGIEIVNEGPVQGPGGTQQWQPYTPAQIRAVILLVRDIARRHGVQPENIVGHSDVAPQRKTDPGPAFPWKQLAQAGLGRWYNEAAEQELSQAYLRQGPPDAAWFQAELERVGYAVPHTSAFDPETTRVIAAFQMHYRPARYDGTPDAETAAILQALP